MDIKIRESTLEKIRTLKYGSAVEVMLSDIISRPNTTYNRGILHGYLLALTTEDIIDSDDAMAIFDQIIER